MNIGEFLGSVNRFDLLVLLFLFGMFVLGFYQGTIRRVLGLFSMLFSFLFAVNIREPLGNFLGANWTQMRPEHAEMIGFLTVFLAATIAFTLVIQGFYHKQSLFQKATIVDELIGGVLGVVQGLFLIACMIIILDSYFANPVFRDSNGELTMLRDLFNFYDPSTTASIYRQQVIPGLFRIFFLFIPQDLRSLFVSF